MLKQSRVHLHVMLGVARAAYIGATATLCFTDATSMRSGACWDARSDTWSDV